MANGEGEATFLCHNRKKDSLFVQSTIITRTLKVISGIVICHLFLKISFFIVLMYNKTFNPKLCIFMFFLWRDNEKVIFSVS